MFTKLKNFLVKLFIPREYTITRCPECGYPMFCGCPACIEDVPIEFNPYVLDKTGEFCTCACCGLTMHASEWMDEDFKQRGQIDKL